MIRVSLTVIILSLLVLLNDGELSDITAYKLDAPVSHNVLPDNALATASAANGDTVTCFACHTSKDD